MANVKYVVLLVSTIIRNYFMANGMYNCISVVLFLFVTISGL